MRLVSICIATYKRPEGLRGLLASIEQQVVDDETGIEIVIVDNDPPSAEASVRDHQATSRFAITYLTQPEPNISLTRNVGVAAARGELVWFVDDDEVAEPECLHRLIEAMDDHGADVVFGPVLPVFEVPLDAWLRPLYDRPVRPTGTPSDAHRTGNTLVRMEALQTVDGPFDEAYGVTGGSDSLLFRRFEVEGRLLIESAEARVSEVVPAERATWRWLKTRMRRQGQNYGRQTITIEGGRWSRGSIWMGAKAAVQVVAWGLGSLAFWDDRTARSRRTMRMWTNIGKLEGLAGVARRRDA